MSKITHEQAEEMKRRLTANGGSVEEIYAKPKNTLAARLCDAQPQPHAGRRPLGTRQTEKSSSGRTLVRITRKAVRLVDFDNGAGGCKYLIDAMRYEKLIPDDSPVHIKFEFEQVKVGSKAEVGTEIIIEALKLAENL